MVAFKRPSSGELFGALTCRIVTQVGWAVEQLLRHESELCERWHCAPCHLEAWRSKAMKKLPRNSLVDSVEASRRPW